MYQPNFTITNNLLTYITRIESAKAIIDNAPLVPAWEARFRDEAFTRTVHYGTKIEGNDLTKEQAEQVLHHADMENPGEVLQRTNIIARERDIQEVINYRNVVAWIDNQRSSEFSEIFTAQTANTIHKLTVDRLIDPTAVGAFRTKQVIVTSAVNANIVYRPPVWMEIPFLMDDFFAWSHSPDAQATHPILRAAISHYQLVYIHPFIEGNGRTARAMATLLLYSLGYDFKRFFSLEQYFDSDVEAYYNALLSVQQSQENNLTYWLEYFCYGLALEVDKVKSQVSKLSKDLKLKKQLGKQVALSERQIMLLELFSTQEEITSDDMKAVLPNISVDTILRDLKDLLQKGIIKKQGVTKGVRYRLVE